MKTKSFLVFILSCFTGCVSDNVIYLVPNQKVTEIKREGKDLYISTRPRTTNEAIKSYRIENQNPIDGFNEITIIKER